MEATLTIVGGKANKRQVSVKLPTVIGRSREADLTIAHPMISRQHCELFEASGVVRIRDLGSLNGTFIGEEQVSESALRPRDRFTVGPITFQVDYEYVGQIATPGAEPVDERQATVGETMPMEETPEFVPEAEPEPESTFDFLSADEKTPSGSAGEEVPAMQGVAVAEQEQQQEQAAPTFFAADRATHEESPGSFAPEDGQVPDFSGWEEEAGGAEQVRQPEAPPPQTPPAAVEDPEPTPPPLWDRPTEESPEQPQFEVSMEDMPTEEAPSAADHDDAPAALASPAATASPLPKKRGWWPFGKEKSKPPELHQAPSPIAEAATEAAEPEQSTDSEAVSASIEETSADLNAVTEQSPESEQPLAPEQPANAQQDGELDPDLDAFFRNLK